MKRQTSLISTAALVAGLAVAAATPATMTAHAAVDDERKAAAYNVTAKVNTHNVTLGEDVVKVRGKVTPRATGKKVLLQQRPDGTRAWTVSTRARIKRNGTYLLTDRPSVVGTRDYRVVKPRSNGLRKGTSPILEVRVTDTGAAPEVYTWQKLAQRPRGASENIAVSSTAIIGAQSYAYSFQPFTRGAPSYVEYPLNGRCTELRTTYAMHDSAAAGSSARITLAVDGVTKVDQVLVQGQVVQSTTDLSGALQLRYDLFSSADPASYPVVATPEVRCR